MPDLGSASLTQDDATNTPAGSAPPNTLDNNIREIKGAVVREWNWRSYTLTAGGSANVKTLTFSVAPDAYRNGQRFAFIANTANTGSASLNVNGLGAKTIRKDVSGTLTDLASGEMAAGMFVEVAFNTANDCFVWVNQQPPLLVDTAKLADNAVTTPKVANLAITTAKIADANVTTAKIADAAATLAKLDQTGATGRVLTAQGAGNPPVWEAARAMTLGTPVNTISGTAIDFIGIPAGANLVLFSYAGLSTNGADQLIAQIGTASGIETTGYLGASTELNTTPSSQNFTTGIGITGSNAANIRHGVLALVRLTGNTWTAFGVSSISNAAWSILSSGSKSLSGPLDRLRLTTLGGTNTFDNGQANVLWGA